ncbi:MAG: hypothetical protein PHE24_03910 [Patescibacteria group bacterium]|nr:hypothetical protein [Patescibacteria group bacterium]
MDTARLPGPGPDFRLNDPHLGFRHKLTEITFKSEYKNIRNDIDLIVDALDPYEEVIRRGGLDHSARFHIWEKIRTGDRSLTHWDMELVMKILEHLSG